MASSDSCMATMLWNVNSVQLRLTELELLAAPCSLQFSLANMLVRCNHLNPSIVRICPPCAVEHNGYHVLMVCPAFNNARNALRADLLGRGYSYVLGEARRSSTSSPLVSSNISTFPAISLPSSECSVMSRLFRRRSSVFRACSGSCPLSSPVVVTCLFLLLVAPLYGGGYLCASGS